MRSVVVSNDSAPAVKLSGSTALAGSPMLCHPYADMKVAPAERGLAERLDGEGETLVRMELLRQALVASKGVRTGSCRT